MKTLTKKTIAYLFLIALTIIAPNTMAGGASGSWGDGSTAGDPYTGNGGSFGGGGGGGSWNEDSHKKCFYHNLGYDSFGVGVKEFNSLDEASVAACSITSNGNFVGYTSWRSSDITAREVQCSKGVAWISKRTCKNFCPIGKIYNYDTGLCDEPKKQCPQGQKLDELNNECIIDPNQCLSPFTLINGICVPPKKPDPETKRCPYGYTLQDNQCVKDPPKDCDPAVQNCDDEGKSKCICEKLQTIIENQGVQIDLHNRTNERLSDILAQQQTNNLKIDGLGQKLDEITKAIKDQDIRKNLAQIEKAIKDNRIDIDTVNTRLDNILQAIKDNRYDDKAMQDLVKKQTDEMISFLKNIDKNTKVASNVSSTPTNQTTSVQLDEVTNRQDEQTKILKDIKYLFKNDDKKDEPLPDPATPETITNDYDPFGALKGFNISQNRINANSQCPVDKPFQIMGRTFVIPMTYLCQFLAMLAPVFLALAYFAGARIIIKG